MPYYKHPPKCGDATAFDWAQIVLSMFSVNVSWWIFDVPKLWKQWGKRAIYQFAASIIWQCLRFSAPAVALVYALVSTTDRTQWVARYYFGFHKDSPDVPPLTKFGLAKILLIDGFAIVSSIVSIVSLCRSGPRQLDFGWEGATYATPGLPVAIYGLATLWLVRTRVKTRFAIFGYSMLIVLAVGVAATIAVSLTKGSRALIITLPIYLVIGLPWATFLPWTLLQFVSVMVAGLLRFGGVSWGAFSDWKSFPFCPLKNPAFGGTYLALGFLSTFFGFSGMRQYFPVMLRSSWYQPKGRNGDNNEKDTAAAREALLNSDDATFDQLYALALEFASEENHEANQELCLRLLAHPDINESQRAECHLILASGQHNFVWHAEQAVQIFEKLSAIPQVEQPASGAPDQTGPDPTIPNQTTPNPDPTTPNQTAAPDQTDPDTTPSNEKAPDLDTTPPNQTTPDPNQTAAPDQTTPDQTTPDQTTPDQTTPDQTTPDQTTPDQTEQPVRERLEAAWAALELAKERQRNIDLTLQQQEEQVTEFSGRSPTEEERRAYSHPDSTQPV